MGEGNTGVSTQQCSCYFLHGKRVWQLLFGTAVWEVFSNYDCCGHFLTVDFCISGDWHYSGGGVECPPLGDHPGLEHPNHPALRAGFTTTPVDA